MRAWHDAADGQARPVHPRARGLGAQRGDQRRGPLGRVRRRPGDRASRSRRSTWIDRLAPRAAAVLAIGHVRRLRRHPGDAQQPDGRDGPARLPRAGTGPRGAGSRSSTSRAARSSPTTSPRRCSAWCCTWPAWARRSSSTSRAARCASSAAPCTRAATAPDWPSTASSPTRHGDGRCLVKLGCKGPVVKCNVPIRGWINGDRRLPERRRHLHGLHDARLPRQVHAVHGGRPAPPALREDAARFSYGPVVKYLRERRIRREFDVEPEWRRRGAELTTGYEPRW